MRYKRTWSLLGSAALAAMLFVVPALAANTTISTATNTPQTINAAPDTLSVTGTGSVTTTGNGQSAISAPSGATSISNAGTVSADGSSAAAIQIGSANPSANIVDITNTGTLSSTTFNTVYVHGNLTGTFLNDVGGVVTTSTDQAIRIAGTTSSFINHGRITDTGEAGVAFDGLVSTFQNDGTISSLSSAVVFGGGVTSATNTGSITETGSTASTSAVIFRNGASSFNNSGTISGVNGLFFDSTTTHATVVNSGSVVATGAAALAIQLTAGDDSLTLMTGSTTTGIVDGKGNTAGDTLVLDGTTTGAFAISQLTNFEKLTKQGTGSCRSAAIIPRRWQRRSAPAGWRSTAT